MSTTTPSNRTEKKYFGVQTLLDICCAAIANEHRPKNTTNNTNIPLHPTTTTTTTITNTTPTIATPKPTTGAACSGSSSDGDEQIGGDERIYQKARSPSGSSQQTKPKLKKKVKQRKPRSCSSNNSKENIKTVSSYTLLTPSSTNTTAAFTPTITPTVEDGLSIPVPVHHMSNENLEEEDEEAGDEEEEEWEESEEEKKSKKLDLSIYLEKENSPSSTNTNTLITIAISNTNSDSNTANATTTTTTTPIPTTTTPLTSTNLNENVANSNNATITTLTNMIVDWDELVYFEDWNLVLELKEKLREDAKKCKGCGKIFYGRGELEEVFQTKLANRDIVVKAVYCNVACLKQ